MKVPLTYRDETPFEVLVFDPLELQQRYWMLGKYYEGARLDALLHRIYMLPKGLVYVDVGACIGNHSIFFAHVMEASRVYAIEPFGRNYRALIRSVAPLDNVTTFNVAAGSKRGKTSLEQYGPEDQWGMVRVCEGGEVEVVPVDELVNGEVDVVKIDVDGDSMAVLDGMTETLKGCPIVFIEAATVDEQDEVTAFLAEYDYVRIGGSMNATPTWEYSVAK